MATDPASSRVDERVEPREEVLHRTRATLADRRLFAVTVVNVSPRGLMLRSDAPAVAGEWLKIPLPVIGEVHAAVRWALGGRIGCELGRAIPADSYDAVLAALRR